jgi:hypothetical protein
VLRRQKPNKRKLLTPDTYQVEALSNIDRHLEVNDRGTVVMACGTGKTLVALWAVEQSKAKSILVLVPSLTLLQQTLEEWSIHNSMGKDFSYLCVCSDPSVNLKNDEIEIDPSDVPFRIDTNPEIVKDFLNFQAILESVNPKAKIILTVSPVPLIATAENKHVLVSTTLSKSILRVAAENISNNSTIVDYFPSYEIITGNFNRGAYFGNDLRSITEEGVSHVMRLFLKHYGGVNNPDFTSQETSQSQFYSTMKELIDVNCDETAYDLKK